MAEGARRTRQPRLPGALCPLTCRTITYGTVVYISDTVTVTRVHLGYEYEYEYSYISDSTSTSLSKYIYLM